MALQNVLGRVFAASPTGTASLDVQLHQQGLINRSRTCVHSCFSFRQRRHGARRTRG
jgi:hypothetical protein